MTRAVIGCYRAIGIVARLRVDHHGVSQKENQEIDEKHVDLYDPDA